MDLDMIINLVMKYYLWPVLLIPIAVISSLYKALFIVNFIDERRRLKITNISNALECPDIKGLTREHLKKEIVNEHFYLNTGIYTQKKLREAILKAHHNTQEKLSFIHYKRALRFLKCKDGGLSLEVKLKPIDNFGGKFMKIYSLLLAFVGLVFVLFGFIFLFYNFNNDLFKLENFVLFAPGLLFIFFAFITLYQNLDFISAMKIKTELEKKEK